MSLTQQVYESLRRDILGLRFEENVFLNEGDLAGRYGVSKSPMREALHRLCMEGILVSHPRKGYLLAAVTPQEFMHAQRLRMLCEGYAMELAMQRPQAEKAALVAMAGRPYAIEDNAAFHLMVADMGGVQTLSAIIRRLLSTVERTISMRSQARGIGLQPADIHLEMAGAIEAGDISRARAALARDLSLSEEMR